MLTPKCASLRTLLNVNAQTSPFYPAINVLELMDLHGTRDWYALENFLRLLRVKTKYMKHKDGTAAVKVKTILSFSQQWVTKTDNKGQVMKDKKGEDLKQRNTVVDPWNAEEVSFRCTEYGNRTLSVAKYFKEKYNITLARPRAWLLNCGTKETPVWIPPELCEVVVVLPRYV